MENKIRSITEAFSMQPMTFYLGMDHLSKNLNGMTRVDRIVEEAVIINGDPYDYYVGYDSKNNRLFEFRKGTVNVMYEV